MRVCIYCEKKFKPGHGKMIYCSSGCRDNNYSQQQRDLLSEAMKNMRKAKYGKKKYEAGDISADIKNAYDYWSV